MQFRWFDRCNYAIRYKNVLKTIFLVKPYFEWIQNWLINFFNVKINKIRNILINNSYYYLIRDEIINIVRNKLIGVSMRIYVNKFRIRIILNECYIFKNNIYWRKNYCVKENYIVVKLPLKIRTWSHYLYTSNNWRKYNKLIIYFKINLPFYQSFW